MRIRKGKLVNNLEADYVGNNNLRNSFSSHQSLSVYEGGSEEEMTEVMEEPGREEETYGDQQDWEGEEIDPDDPYQINRLDDIPHDDLKELYAQVVDELLDMQLEFEEKIAEVEEKGKEELELQK